MIGFLRWAAPFVFVAILMFVALKAHKSTGKHSKVLKPVGVILALLAGMALLATTIGGWFRQLIEASVILGAVGFLACVAVLAIDWLADKKPDKPAFWAAFLLPLFLVAGLSQVPAAIDQIGRGGQQITTELNSHGGK